jgi:hypothetical protein
MALGSCGIRAGVTAPSHPGQHGARRGPKALCVTFYSPFPKGGPKGDWPGVGPGEGTIIHLDCRLQAMSYQPLAHGFLMGTGG